LKKYFTEIKEPLVMIYRVNAGFIPKEHWTQNENIGGGRIIGEVCHFIDLMQYFTSSLPETVYAESISSGNGKMKNDDNINVLIKFSDGSIGSIVYIANGDKALPKERMEISGGGKTGVINDFRNGQLYSQNKLKVLKLEGKGHKQEVEAFLSSLSKGHAMPISFESMYHTTKATFKILDSLRTGLPQKIRD
jgi:polar amino acid transport system substrate-binding protein